MKINHVKNNTYETGKKHSKGKHMCLYQGIIIIIIYAICTATTASFEIIIIQTFTIHYNDYEYLDINNNNIKIYLIDNYK